MYRVESGVIKFDAECEDCNGTGLYVGMCERDGYAVVCIACKGTGCVSRRCKLFTERQKRNGVTHVLQANTGIVVGSIDSVVPGRDLFGGMPYKDWFAGKPFPSKSEMRLYTCPAWWYQSADYKRKPRWKECNAMLGGRFSDCTYFCEKHKCWQRWDKENP